VQLDRLWAGDSGDISHDSRN